MTVRPGESAPEGQNVDQVRKARTVLADVYSFVRSRELNKSISSFTFDHYIEQAKLAIKGDGKSLRDSLGQAFGVRSSQLEALESLEREFNENLPLIEDLVSQAEEEDNE